MKKVIFLLLFAVLVVGCSNNDDNTTTTIQEDDMEIIADNLNIPWELVFLPDGNILVTERPGNLLMIKEDKTMIKIDGVHHIGEGGLLGLALHPEFNNNNLIYLYLTTQTKDGLSNRVERYRLINAQLSDRKIIIENIPGAAFHDGGRINFGPDKKLYITTGDAGNSQLAQDKNSLAGKILRLNNDGSIPSDNPFNNAVYSYGHRNPQGIAWDNNGNLYVTEHGRSGIQSGLDELNLILPGNNYGWPVIQGDDTKAGMTSPIIHSGSATTWAPASAVYYQGSIFFTGLRGEALYQAIIKDDKVSELKTHLKGKYGRLRAITLHDGYFYISTSNRDGRGDINPNDDKIIKINPSYLS